MYVWRTHGYVLCFYIFIESIQHNAYMSYVNDTYSYQILNPKGIKGIEDPKKCTKILIESTELAEDQYRLGNTKARNLFYIYTKYTAQITSNTSKTKQIQQKHSRLWLKNRCPDTYTHIHLNIEIRTHTHSQYEKMPYPNTRQKASGRALSVCVLSHSISFSLFSL